jgi:predicted nucleic acid-binding protein
MTFPVVLDTCVLFPMYLRDSLLRLAAADLFQPVWSPQILSELERVLVREGFTNSSQATRIIRLMRENFPSAEITEHEPLIDAMTCDEADRHVLAAAVKAGASILVTANRSDFPARSTEPYEIEVLSPDELLLDLLDTAPTLVVRTLTRQAERYKREPTTLHGLLAALGRAGASNFADEVRRIAA